MQYDILIHIITCYLLGDKFVYESRFNQKIYNDYRDTINQTRNSISIVDFDSLSRMKETLHHIKFDNMNRCISPDRTNNSKNGFLRQCLYTTNQFFKYFNSIMVIHTDKGNSMVILNKTTYYNKMYMHLDDGINNGTYSEITLNQDIIDQQNNSYNTIHLIYTNWVNNIKNKNNNCTSISRSLLNFKKNNNHTFYAAHIYGTLKVHKADNPIRPIVADFANPVQYIQKLLKIVLCQYIKSERFQFIIKNSKPIIEYCKYNKINSIYRLATLDYSSMYTNIDLLDFYSIIDNEFDLLNIHNLFCISKEDLLFLFKNTMEHFTYIKHKNSNNHMTYYIQSKGIPMGGALSYHISEVVTARHFENLINLSPDRTIERIFKYVDDVLIICLESFYANTHLINQSLNHMKYDLTTENEDKQVIFLDLRIQRLNTKILHQWYNKPYSSHRSLDFLSAQPLHMKINVLEQLYTTILKSCSINQKLGITKFRHIAKINHYPKHLINKILRDHSPKHLLIN